MASGTKLLRWLSLQLSMVVLDCHPSFLLSLILQLFKKHEGTKRGYLGFFQESNSPAGHTAVAMLSSRKQCCKAESTLLTSTVKITSKIVIISKLIFF